MEPIKAQPRKQPIVLFWWGVVVGFLGLVVLSGLFLLLVFAFSDFDRTESKSGAYNRSLPQDFDYSGVEDLYDLLRVHYDGPISEAQLVDGLKRGLTVAVGDPYTQYFNAAEAAVFYQNLAGEFEGIGIEIHQRDSQTIVVAAIEGTPAAAAGIKSKDIILAVDGQSIAGWGLNQVAGLIMGDAGTEVRLTIQRAGEIKEIVVERAVINIKSLSWTIDDRVLILRVRHFGDDLAEETVAAATALADADYDGIIVDLRFNPGGGLDQARHFASFWLPPEAILVQQQVGGQIVEPILISDQGRTPLTAFEAVGRGQWRQQPTVVLINEGSASASEIIAAALADHDQATIVGRQSFGKGSVQTVETIGNNEMVKVTTARWLTPTATVIDGLGISPDVIIDDDDDDDGDQAPTDRFIEAARVIIKEASQE